MTRAAAIALAGMAALAVAMGIGRFAFTPVLPMMQHDRGLTLAQGGWLASANYLGYFAGAVLATRSRMRAALAITLWLFAISIATGAAAISTRFEILFALRFVAGLASALVLVHVSSWALDALSQAGRPELRGIVFAGVGVGIVCAGLACIVLAGASASSDTAWITLGGIALAVSLAIAPLIRGAEGHAQGPGPASPREPLARHWRLIYAHAAFGFGYIIPATFLPVMAKKILGDTALFGWAWPIFGAASALSTWLCVRLAGHLRVRDAWAGSLVVMAVGVASPVVVPGIVGILIAAVCVGASFMVATMLAMQEARSECGDAARPLMGAMTTAFALGQIAGPLVVSGATDAAFAHVLLIASVPLLLAAYLLWRRT